MLIHNKNDIELVTEFPCLLGHPVVNTTIEKLVRLHSSNFFDISEVHG